MLDRLAGLELRVERIHLERLQRPAAVGGVRTTVLVCCEGGGERGLPVDVVDFKREGDAGLVERALDL